MTPAKHQHIVIERSPRAELVACYQCNDQPFALRTAEGTGDLFTRRFYSDLAQAQSAYRAAKAKGGNA